jgi:hypothetical protein
VAANFALIAAAQAAHAARGKLGRIANLPAQNDKRNDTDLRELFFETAESEHMKKLMGDYVGFESGIFIALNPANDWIGPIFVTKAAIKTTHGE